MIGSLSIVSSLFIDEMCVVVNMTRNTDLLKIRSVQEKGLWKCIWLSPLVSPKWWNFGIQICTDLLFGFWVALGIRGETTSGYEIPKLAYILSFVLSMNKHDNDRSDLANVPTCWISKGSQLEIPVERLVNITILITTVVLDEWVSFSSTKNSQAKWCAT